MSRKPADVARTVEAPPAKVGDGPPMLAQPDLQASASAPFLYFENAVSFGHVNGLAQVTLTAGRLYPDGKGHVATDVVMVGHLRTNFAGARSLRDALDKVLLMAEPVEQGLKN